VQGIKTVKAAQRPVLQEVELLVAADLEEQQFDNTCAPKCLACAGQPIFTIALFMQWNALAVKKVSSLIRLHESLTCSTLCLDSPHPSFV
jgi:hypothetical protein